MSVNGDHDELMASVHRDPLGASSSSDDGSDNMQIDDSDLDIQKLPEQDAEGEDDDEVNPSPASSSGAATSSFLSKRVVCTPIPCTECPRADRPPPCQKVKDEDDSVRALSAYTFANVHTLPSRATRTIQTTITTTRTRRTLTRSTVLQRRNHQRRRKHPRNLEVCHARMFHISLPHALPPLPPFH